MTVKNSVNLSFNNGKPIVPLLKENLDVKLGGHTLNTDEYEIISIRNNNFLGTATAVIKGKGEYGGTKKFTFKIGARELY